MIIGWPRARMIWIWLNCSPAKSGLSTPEPKLARPNKPKPTVQRIFGEITFINWGTSGIRNSWGTPIHMITSPICNAL
ncbi:hypothetical protein D3C79_806410 [compost metagenome]